MIEISCSIVLYHNQIQQVKKAVESVLACSRKIKLYLVDNSRNDDFRFQFISPDIEYIFTGKNLGYGAAHNLAIREAQGNSLYHIILNPDIHFDPQALDTLFRFMQQNRNVGLVMPKVLYNNGDLQYLCKRIPSPADLLFRRFVPGAIKKLLKKNLDAYELRDKDYNSIMEVPNLSGCFMFIRTSVFKHVGLFDEQFFMYLEDTDLCRRINRYYRTVYYPLATIVHGYEKGSYKNLKLMGYHLRSSILYFNKWGWLNDQSRDSANRGIDLSSFIPRTERSLQPAQQSTSHLSITLS